MRIEQNTVNKILQDIRNQNSLNYTCTKIESINVTNTGAKLNPPSNTLYCVIQVNDGGAGDSTKVLRISECSTTTATTSLGLILGALDIYDIRGSNNITGVSLCSIDNVTNSVVVMYYTSN